MLSIVLSIPAVQTKIGKHYTDKINEDFGIKDHHKDTMIYVEKLTTSIINAKRILDKEVFLNDIYLDGAYYYMKTYKGEEDDNMGVFIDSFDDGSPKDSLNPFVLKTSNVYVNNLNFRLTNANKADSVNYAAKNAGGNLQDF